jgi:hypothetical protein
LLLLASCAHTDIALNSGAPPAAGTSVVSSSAGLQVNASGGAAAALLAGVLIAGTVHDLNDPAPRPEYRSFSDWFWGRPAPRMDPGRTVSDQDCSKPIESSGNLRCR